MNYRHLFHAGNFADLLKHVVLLSLVRELTKGDAPLTVIDTHAGAGLYDLESEAALKTGEANAGVGRLLAATDCPDVFEALKAAVVRANKGGATRYYPGSPLLIAGALRAMDRYIGCELRADDFEALRAVLRGPSKYEILNDDGWRIAAERAPQGPAPLLALIDPPFERPDDADKASELIEVLLKRNSGAVIALWAPIKDLTTFDALACDIQDAAPASSILVIELRLRELIDPMRMNGCAMIVVNAPVILANTAAEGGGWLAERTGDAGALARVEWRNH